MKKLFVVASLSVVGLAFALVIFFRSSSAKENAPAVVVLQVSPEAAKSLQAKIDAIKKASKTPNRQRGTTHIELSEAELESYVLYSLKDDIPVQLDSIDVQLAPGTVGADTQLTFASSSTGNPMIDALVGGTHNLFVRGKLSGMEGRGKFDLEDIRVDGIPVPKVLIQTLFDKYVKPKYPDADLKEPFDLPWKIQEITLEPQKATIVY